jgi:hypothetical protein
VKAIPARQKRAYAGAVSGGRRPTWLLALAVACGGGPGFAPTTGTDTGTAAGTSSSSGSSTGAVDPTGGEFVPLVDPMAWTPVPAQDDPLADHRPADVQCPIGGWLFEPQGFEVNTLQCNYAMFSAPAQAAVVAGNRVVATLYHFDLVAAEPASAHVALLIGDTILWQTDVAIPGKANAFNVDVVADTTVPAGTPVYFHLHNHGQNTWTLGAVEVEVSAADAG